jgi:hypothetical protein
MYHIFVNGFEITMISKPFFLAITRKQ